MNLSRRERRALEREQKRSRVSPKPSRAYWYWLVPCLAAFLIYARSLSFGFINDDWAQIVTNPQVRSWRYLPRILSTDLWSQRGEGHRLVYYRPVFSLWMLIVHTVAGLSPSLWHLANVLLHVIVTFLVFKVGVAILDSPIGASGAALLFAVHPVHIEDVCWVSAGNEMIYTGFLLCSLLLLFYGNRQPRPAYIWLSLAAWGAALLTKETAIALLPLFILLAYFGWPESSKKSPGTALAFVSVAAVYLVTRWIVLRHLSEIGNGEASWSQTLLTAPFAAGFYLHKLIIPTYLSPRYRCFLQSVPNFISWLQAGAIVFGMVLIAYLLRKRPTSGIWIALVFLPLFPVIAGIHYFRNLRLEMVHERYLYLPSVGLVLLLGIALKYLWRRSRNTTIASGLLLAVVCIALNLSQQYPYQNEVAFSRQSLIVTGWHPEKFAEMTIRMTVDHCKFGEYERARELLKPPPSTVAFYRRSSETLFFAKSFDFRPNPMTYVTPEGVRGSAPIDDLDLRVTACLNPELVGRAILVANRSTPPAITAQ